MAIPNNPRPFRAPRLRVLIDGIVATTAIDARIVSNNYFSADWFNVSLVSSTTSQFSSGFWASVEKPLVDVQISTNETQPFKRLILGYADSISIDAIRNIIRIDGRDLSASLVDSSLHEAFPNYTADAIVSLLALRHRLNPKVSPTPGLVGRLFGGDQAEMGFSFYSRTMTDWDLIVRLAQQAGYDAYVIGRDFYFHPKNSNRDATIVLDKSTVTVLHLERNLTLENSGPFTAVSWNSQLDQPVFSAPGDALSVGADGGGTQVFLEPNLRSDNVASAIAQMIADTRQQARSLEIGMPGDTEVTARSRMRLVGTDTAFDQTYDIEYVDRMFSPTTGFRQRIRARQVSDGLADAARSLII